MTHEEILNLARDKIKEIGEHCTSVQIFCTISDPDDHMGHTGVIRTGVGDIYARMAASREWVLMMDEQARIKAKRDYDERNNPPDSEDLGEEGR